MINKFPLIAALSVLLLQGCTIENAVRPDPMTSPADTPTNSPSLITPVYSSIKHCFKAEDVPHCDFRKGIYVLALDPSITEEQHQRVILQTVNFLKWSHRDVDSLFKNQTIVLGILPEVPTKQSDQDNYIKALFSTPQQVQGLELIYTNNGSDETLSLMTYQKLMQLFDYYVDGGLSTHLGSELNDAYQDFKRKLTIYNRTAAQQDFEALRYNEYQGGNGQLQAKRALGTPIACTYQGSIQIGGAIDPMHGKTEINLNPGTLLGLLYEYKVDPARNTGGGQLIGNRGSRFINEGKVASGLYPSDGPNMYLTWANPAFKPLNDYLNMYFFTNK